MVARVKGVKEIAVVERTQAYPSGVHRVDRRQRRMGIRDRPEAVSPVKVAVARSVPVLVQRFAT